MKYTKDNKFTATIIDMHDGTYAIAWPCGWDDDGYTFKTLRGAQRRLERNGWEQVA